MKSSIVPAQITSVEDKIVAGLNFLQIMILSLPIFISASLFEFTPPYSKMTILKTITSIIIAVLVSPLAIKLKGRVLFLWVVILITYLFRPRKHVFKKDANFYREIAGIKSEDTKVKSIETAYQNKKRQKMINLVSVNNEGLVLVNNKKGNYEFKVKKSTKINKRTDKNKEYRRWNFNTSWKQIQKNFKD